MLENDNTVLIKGLKKVVNVKFSRNTHLIETSYDRLKSRNHFSNTGKILLKQEFSDGLNIHEHKDITIPLIIHYYLHESIQNTTQNLSTLNHNVRFLPCQHRGVGAPIQYVYALNPVCIVLIIPTDTPAEVPRRGYWT